MPNRPVAAAIATVGLAVVALWLWQPTNDAPAGPPATGTDASGTAARRASAIEGSVPAAVAERDAVAPPGPDERPFVLRGRIVAADDGAPIADARLAATRDDDTRDRDDPAPTTTLASGTDGRFTIAVACAASLRVQIDASGFARATGRWKANAPREVDVGDVLMIPATVVEGEVVDERGSPVADAELMLATLKAEGPAFAPLAFVRTESGPDGRFRFPEPVAARDYYAIVNNAGGLVGPRDVNVPPRVDHHFLRITTSVPDAAQAIRGSVVDESGAPLERVTLRANGDGSTGSARVRPDGTFALHRSGAFTNDGTGVVRLFPNDPDGGHELASPLPPTRWGADDVRIVMHRRAAVAVVVADRDGTPVPSYDVLLLRSVGSGVQPSFARARGRADGRIVLANLTAGDHRALVRLPDGTAAAAPVAFTVDQEHRAADVRVACGPLPELTVEIVDTNGAPVVGSTAEAMLVFAGEPPGATTPVRELATIRDGDERSLRSLTIVRATTSATGRAAMRLPGGDYQLRVRGALHLPTLQAVRVGDAGSTARVVVEGASRIRGRCEPFAALAKLRAAAGDDADPITIVAMHDGKAGAVSPLEADGAFSLDGLRPGTWSVQLQAPMRFNPDDSATVTLPLGDVELLPAGVERTFAIGAVLPAIVAGTVTLDGAPWPLAQLRFHRAVPQSPVRAVADANGRFHTLLPPGEYNAAVAFAAQPGPGWISVVLAQPFTAVAEREQRADLAARSRSVEVHVRDADGRPVRNARVRISAALGYYRPGQLTTDGAGNVAISHPPYGPFDLFATVGDREVRFGPAEMPFATDTATIEVRPSAR
ncbi:MAG: hypothetical protein JNK78_01880 [Planctomycetes bacterium]|nr:hypothetical protein [Planctomycetota bacterium]